MKLSIFVGLLLLNATASAQSNFSFPDKPKPTLDCVGALGNFKIGVQLILKDRGENVDEALSALTVFKDQKAVAEFGPAELKSGLVSVSTDANAASGLETVEAAMSYHASGSGGLVDLRGPTELRSAGKYLLSLSIPSADLSASELELECTPGETLPSNSP